MANAEFLHCESELPAESVCEVVSEGRALPLSVQQNYMKSLEIAIDSADRWEKEDKSAFKPYSPEYVKGLFQGRKPTVWTARMLEMWDVAERLTEWETRTAQFFTANLSPPPPLSALFQHIQTGKDVLLPSVDIREPLTRLQTAYDSAVKWRDSARAALRQGLSPQHMSNLVVTSHALICTFEELLEVRRRAEINLKIATTLQGVLTEQTLLGLSAEAERLGADPAYRQEVDTRVRNMRDLKACIAHAIDAELAAEECQRLLSEIDAQRLELPEDRARLMDATTSLALLKRFQCEYIADRSEVEALLIETTGVRHVLPSLQTAYNQLALRYWEAEYDRMESLSELTLEEVADMEAKSRAIPCSHSGAPLAILTKIRDLREAANYCEQISGMSVESLFSGDLLQLSEELAAVRTLFTKEKVVVPGKFAQLFQYAEWVGWSNEVQTVLNAARKPAIEAVFALRARAKEVAAPAQLPCVRAVEQAIQAHEHWCARFDAHSDIRKWYAADIELQLKTVREHPKSTYESLRRLIQDCNALPCDCDRQLMSLQMEVEQAESWLKKANSVLNPDVYVALLKAAKRSYSDAKESPMFVALRSAMSEYMCEVQIKLEDFDQRFCCYSWNFAALCILQRTDKTSQQYWDSFYSQIAHIGEKYRDVILVERIRMQESKRKRAEAALAALCTHNASAMTLDDLYSLSEQVAGCKVEIAQTDFLRSVVDRVNDVVQQTEILLTEKAPRSQFEKAKYQLGQLPISVPEIVQRLDEVVEKADKMAKRIAEIRGKMQKERIARGQIESILIDSELLPIKLPEAESISECFESAKEVLKDAQKAAVAPSLSFILRSLSRLDSTSIHLGAEEVALRCKLWKLKYRLALESTPKLPFETFQKWFSETDSMPELDLDHDLQDLEKYMEIGERLRKRVETASDMEIAHILKDAQTLPFDLSNFVAMSYNSEQTAFRPAAQFSESNSEYIPPKRHKPNEALLAANSDPIRGIAMNALESVLVADELIPKEYARNLAYKIESWLFRHCAQGKNYDYAVQETVRVVDTLMSYEGFSEKLMSGGVRWKTVRRLKPEDVVSDT